MDKKKKGKTNKKGRFKNPKKKEDQSAKNDSLNVLQEQYKFPSIHEEMADLFDEDKVTHKHGGTEPEAD